MHDLVLRNATVVDGTGGPLFEGDVAVDDGRITAVGEVTDRGRDELDARGQIVTPGFVDPHTHYDGQATWDPLLTPSIWHGVTTVVMGNCGVGFAPVAPDQREWLIGLMEGVEDIPGTALYEGIRWDWESIPEYLDTLDRFPRSIDVAAQVTHGSVRAYVMGERGAANETATDEDIERMAAIVRDGIAAGAVGFSTNRLAMHLAVDGRPVPGTFADTRELFAIARAAREASPGADAVYQVITAGSMGGLDAWPGEIDWMGQMSRETGLPCTFTFGQSEDEPERWRDLLAMIGTQNAGGARLVPQVSCRPLCILIGLPTKHPWIGRPSYDEIASLPVPEQARLLADPERKARVLGEVQGPGNSPLAGLVLSMPAQVFRLGSPPNYEPLPELSLASLAGAANRDTEEMLYDLILEDDGQNVLLFTLGGYAYSNLEHDRELLSRSDTVLGLDDGGAHVSIICGGSYPTMMLGYWTRDRVRGPRLALELAVRKLTSEPARLYGMHDRGVIRAGAKADLNVIDLDTIEMHAPEILYDLPAGAKRLVQKSDGYVATIVNGAIVQRDGEDTGARPGRLVRGPQPAA